MTNQLPVYLHNIRRSELAENAAAGIASALPPHISIRGNAFHLIDATGEKQSVGSMLDVCFVGRNPNTCKMFYPDAWNANSTDPPLCWSMNGVGPSTEAIDPQAQTCAACPQNVRGSDVSSMSGKPIKACRDELVLAALVVGYLDPTRGQMVSFDGDMLFRFTVTPGSFKSWKAYVDQYKTQSFDMSVIVTRLSFEPQKNGVITFQARPWVQGGPSPFIDEVTAGRREKALAGTAIDLITGKTDRPIPNTTMSLTTTGSGVNLLAPQFTAEALPTQSSGLGAAFGGSIGGSTSQQVPQGNGHAVETQRRKRRTRAEIDADNARQAQSTQQPAPAFAAPQPGAPQQPTHAFMPVPQQPASAPSFGIQQGTSPPQEMSAMLDSVFKS